MKKGTSFYLEEDILEEIESYRVSNGLKSKNTALERLVLEYKTLQKELEYTKVLADYAKAIMQTGQITPTTQPQTNMQNNISSTSKRSRTIKSAYDSME